MFEFQVYYHTKTKRWSVNVYLDGQHHELKNFDTFAEVSQYILDTVPPEAR